MIGYLFLIKTKTDNDMAHVALLTSVLKTNVTEK